MEANKVMVTITVECLDVKAVPDRVLKALEQIDLENLNGKLTASDGDSVEWLTNIFPVVFYLERG